MDSNSICNPDPYVWSGQGRSKKPPAKNWTWTEPPSFFGACQPSRQEHKARWADSSLPVLCMWCPASCSPKRKLCTISWEDGNFPHSFWGRTHGELASQVILNEGMGNSDDKDAKWREITLDIWHLFLYEFGGRTSLDFLGLQNHCRQ